MSILTLGTFDLFHYGHVRFLKRCVQIADNSSVYVGLNTDKFIIKYKGVAPVMNYLERKKSILASFPETIIIPNEQKKGNIKDVLKKANVGVIIIGSDWMDKDYLKQIGLTRKDFEEMNMSLLYIPYTQHISTTMLKERLCQK